MNLVVCIKQVPDTTDIKVDPETGTLKRETAGTTINPFDLYAVEEALRVKEKLGGKVTVITMGPPMAQEILRMTIGMGVDDAILLTDRRLAGSDTWATAYALSKAIQKIGFDIVFFGKQAIDGDTAQVGPSTSEYLDVPSITWVKKIREINDKEIIVERMMEDGIDVVKSSIPVALTVVKDINQPRLESLKGKMRAKKYEIPTWSLDDIGGDEKNVGLKYSPTRVAKSWAPERHFGKVEMLDGADANEKVEKLYTKIKQMGLIK